MSEPVTVFLDMDGVLATPRTRFTLSRTCLRRLKSVLTKHHHKVVISSSWRIVRPREYFVSLGLDLHEDWRTRSAANGFRGAEIFDWLKLNNRPRYVILDDETDFASWQLPFLIQTNGHGLSGNDAYRLDYLMNELWNRPMDFAMRDYKVNTDVN